MQRDLVEVLAFVFGWGPSELPAFARANGEVKRRLLDRVDECRKSDTLSFLEAAELYILLDAPLERVMQFMQRRC